MPVQIDISLAIQVIGAIFTVASAAGVVRWQLSEHDERIKAGTMERALMIKDISRLDREVAVLSSKHQEHDGRFERLSEELKQMETRILTHVDQLARNVRNT